MQRILFIFLLAIGPVIIKAEGPKKTAPTDEFCEIIKELTKEAANDELSTLALGQTISMYLDDMDLYTASSAIPGMDENFVYDNTPKVATVRYLSVKLSEGNSQDAANTEAKQLAKKVAACLGASAKAGKDKTQVISGKGFSITINTTAHEKDWLIVLTLTHS